MSYPIRRRRHHVRRQAQKQVIFLSETALDIWHQCRSRAIETIQKGQRFSLISSLDYQATLAAQAARNLHRSSASGQIRGFHVVCAECRGFVVRNGVVRNCPHYRDSTSILSNESDRIRPGASSRSSTQLSNQVLVSVQPPTPRSSLERDSRRKSHRSAGVYSTDTAVGQKRRSVKLQRRKSFPAILRPGYVVDHRGVWNRAHDEEAMTSSAYPPKSPRSSIATADDGEDLSIRAGDAVRGDRLHRQTPIRKKPGLDDDRSGAGQSPCISEAILQDWAEWSEKWEHLVTGAEFDADDSGSIDRFLCDPDSLMREWREWSERWERSLREG